MKRVISGILITIFLLTLLPATTFAAATQRTPIYIGYADVDYMAELILQEIPTQGKSDKEQIRAVYDWIIRNCSRTDWDGTFYFTEEEVYGSGLEQFYLDGERKLQSGEIRLREELELEAGIVGDMFFLSYDSNEYIATFASEMMVWRTGNCAHFSALLALLLGHLGYDCRLIDGVFVNRSGSTIEHKWNYVLVDGTYYWLDVRMDHSSYESSGSIGYYYFMEPSTAVWEKRHQWDHTYSNWLAAHSDTIMRSVYNITEPGQEPWGKCSAWAQDTMQQAWDMGLIPDVLAGADLTKGITRQEFASVAVTLYEKLSSTAVPKATSPFTDTNDADVARAYALGVVNGVGANRYDPYATLTREQAVTMLGRVCELALLGTVSDGSELVSLTEDAPPAFSDSSSISAYARNYIDFFTAIEVINGMGDSRFMPQGTMTREQALKVAWTTAVCGIV